MPWEHLLRISHHGDPGEPPELREKCRAFLKKLHNHFCSNTVKKRGQIKKGFYADIIIFDPDRFTDKADYKDSFQYAEGLEYSIINGKLSVEKGEFTGQLNGKVLKNVFICNL